MSKTPLPRPRVIVAAAGARKTTHLVDTAAAAAPQRILITTFTVENVAEIERAFIARHNRVPPHVTVMSWFSFLIQECIRPYQNAVISEPRIKTIAFPDLPEAVQRIAKSNVIRYYLTKDGDIYKDRAAEFACHADDASEGKVIRRLSLVFDQIFVDELQDMGYYDLVLLEKLFASSIPMLAAGDPRQATYVTHTGKKYRQFTRKLLDWLSPLEKKGVVEIEHRTESFRCNQAICDFADALYPEYRKTTSMNKTEEDHMGVFCISKARVPEYVSRFSPVALRHNKNANTLGLRAFNFGIVKGRTFPRVLIFATAPMQKYLITGNLEDAGSLERLYVAVTRAQHSVTFAVDAKTAKSSGREYLFDDSTVQVIEPQAGERENHSSRNVG